MPKNTASISNDVCGMVVYLHQRGPGALAYANARCTAKAVLVWRRCVRDMVLRETSTLHTVFSQYLRQDNGLRYEYGMVDPLDELMDHYHSTYTILKKTKAHIECPYSASLPKPDIPYTKFTLRALPSVDTHSKRIRECHTMRCTNNPMYFSVYDTVLGHTRHLMKNEKTIRSENKRAKEYSQKCKREYIETINTR